MTDSPSYNVKLAASGSDPVVLPSGETAANAQFSRDGMDLYLREPGQTIKVEGYFSHDPPPDLVSADGARLPHQMVDAFLPPQHPGEYAANNTANDASPVGKVTEVVGDATVTHPDGTHAKADAGMAIHMGDVIQTSAKGAVHILFADNTTFAISESARLSVDNYTYNPGDHTGTSFFSMLHGVFVYTSGLIGKTDPGNVNIETPVGSIGIRGTVIAGSIHAAGQASTVTVVDGAIVVTNGAGTLQMNSNFDTATLTSYSSAPSDTGVMNPTAFNAHYSAVAPADPAFYPMTGTPAPATTPHAPSTVTPDTMTQHTGPGATVGTTVTVTGTSTVNIPDAHDPTVADPNVALTSATVTAPTTATTFTDTSSTFGATPDGSSSFDTTSSPSLVSTGGGDGSTGLQTASGSGLSNTTSLGGGTPVSTGPAATATFAFTDPYTNGTPSVTADDGIPLFGTALASEFSTQTWNNTFNLGTVSTTNLTAPTFSMTGTDITPHVGSGGGFDLTGQAVTFTDPISGATSTQTEIIAHFDINPAGVVSMTILDPQGMVPSIQSGAFNDITITASDGTASAHTIINNIDFQPVLPSGALTILVGDQTVTGTADTFDVHATPGNYLIWGQGGDDVISVGAGQSVLIGDTGNDTLHWTGGGEVKMYGGPGDDTIVMDSNTFLSPTDLFSYVDGGTGTNTLQVGPFTGAAQTFDFEGKTNVQNINTIDIVGSVSTVNTVQIDFNAIFEMTANDPSHTLIINSNGSGIPANVIVDTAGELQSVVGAAVPASGTLTGIGDVTFTGQLVSNGATVTLIIEKGASTADVAVSVH